MRALIVVLIAALLAACPRSQPPGTGGEQPGAASAPAVGEQAAAGPDSRLAVVLSATESDPWTSEIVATLGAELGFDPWSQASSPKLLDVFGPFQVVLDARPIELSICLTGLSAVSDVPGQEALGAAALEWLEQLEPDLVWLDGDPAQFQVGRHLPEDWRVVFSGVVIDRGLYYGGERLTTGVYRRYSLPRVLREIWTSAPEAETYVLLSDDSPISLGRAQRFAQLEAVLPEGHAFVGTSEITGWDELRSAIGELAGGCDALIVCGVGEDGCSEDFLAGDCPADLLAGVGKPVVALGPSRIDYSGALSLRIKPSVHAQAALKQIGRILSGVDPRSIPVETPDDMAVFRSETATEPDPAAAAPS